MGVIKVIISILLVIASLGGALIFSYKYAQNNPFDNSHRHELTLVEATVPTCDTAGQKAHYICKGCGGVFADEKGYASLTPDEVVINPLGHNFENLSCAGVKKCATCGLIEGTGSSHTPDVAIKENVVNGSCIAEGSYESVIICKVCGQEISRETVKTPVTGHVNNDGDNKCDVCKAEVCVNHVPVIDPAIAPTCTEDGLTEGSHCDVCNTVIVAQKVVPAGHYLKVEASGTIIRNADGTHNTDQFLITIGCTNCDDYEPEIITDYTVSAEDPFESGVIINVGNSKISYPALDYYLYEISSTYDGNDKTPTVTTSFALGGTEFVYALITGHCIDLDFDGDNRVYSIYELDSLDNDNVTVSYDAEKGYTYASKQNHTISYLAAYGCDLTVTGDVHVFTPSRLNINTHLIVGSDDVAANLKVERVEKTDSNNEVIALWQSGGLTVKNGTLTTVCKATSNYGVDIRVAANSSSNPSSDSLIFIDKQGSLITEGVGEYSIFINKGANGRVIIDGSLTTDRTFVVASNLVLGDEYEYGFQPAFYVRHGTVTVNGAQKPGCFSSVQVGSEEENAKGTLSITSSQDIFRMALSTVRFTFANGTLNFECTANDKTIIQTGGDGSSSPLAAYRPYHDSAEKSVCGVIDFKKDIVVNAKVASGSKSNYFLGIWRNEATFVQSWLVEEGATFNFTDIQLFARTPSGNNVKLIAYSEKVINIDGENKTALVAAKLADTITRANTAADLVYLTLDENSVWTTDSATAAVHGFSFATDADGNGIYYQLID